MAIKTNPAQGLDDLSIRELLDADSRPTFVIDLDPDEPVSDFITTISPIFCNASLRFHERLHDAVIGNEQSNIDTSGHEHSTNGAGRRPMAGSNHESEPAVTHEAFKAWATGVTTHDDSKDVFPLSFLFQGLLWTGSTVAKRWRFISGNRLWRAEDEPSVDLASGAPIEVATGGLRAVLKSKKTPSRKSRTNTLNDSPSMALESEASSVSISEYEDQPIFYPRQSTSGASILTGISKSSKSNAINIGKTGERCSINWNLPSPEGRVSSHLEYVRSVDWSKTPLGPMEQWSSEFCQITNLVMANQHPAALLWGSTLTLMYNEAYANEVAGNKHPSIMGTDFADCFEEVWDYCGPLFEECGRSGIGVRKDNDFLTIYRHGRLEETYYSWTYTPIYSSSTGDLLGFYNAPFQTTSMVLNQRRMEIVTALGEGTGAAKTIKQFWKFVLSCLERQNPRDVPFALLYSVGEEDDGEYSSAASETSISLKSCFLEGSLGIPKGHAAIPQQLDLRRSLEGFVPSFREAMRTREPTLLHVKSGTLPEVLLEGIEWRGFGEPCNEAIIFPVRPTTADNVLAFLVLGVNPRRPYDQDYKAFTTMFNRQLATSLASTILFEEEARQMRDAFEAAHLEKEKLTQQVELQASRLRRMTELSPLGMFLISPEGVLREANDRFFEMTGLPRDSQYELSWMDIITEDSMKTMEDGWHKLSNEHLPWSGELQMKVRSAKSQTNQHSDPIDYWVMFIAQPEIAPDGSLRSLMGSITDVSKIKWAHNLQNHQLREADETRRQQNEFIDITSHEMRNPMSAILQCADDITMALTACRKGGACPGEDIIDNCLESAQTISLCVQHQKSIVDDILTVSKLDSNLLLITPVPSQPQIILSRALKMFESELQAKDIGAKLNVHASYQKHEIDWVTMDPSRVLQILINLLTNAIKFTAPSQKRCLTVAIGASKDAPTLDHISGFQFAPLANNIKNKNSHSEEWQDEEVVYICFMVQDTGCGLTSEEKQLLFQRFKQASPRTHAQYGGSGLGLFISKRLAELQGGQIGVASEAGKGSLFSFYVQARRCGAPSEEQIGRIPLTGRQLEDKNLHQQFSTRQQDLSTAGEQGSSSSLGARKTTKEFDPNKITILVVEDNLINQRVLVRQLKKAGCNVNLANDGIEALEFLKTTHFYKGPKTPVQEDIVGANKGVPLDIVLMDLEMPRMDGLTCVTEIRKMEASGEISGHVPIIAVTANVRDQQVATAKDSGMDDVLSKPFRIPDVLEKVRTLLLRDNIAMIPISER